MGISDRDYARADADRRGARTRLGVDSLRLMSFTAWVIVINIAVFVLGIVFSGHGIPVYMNTELLAERPPGRLAIQDQLYSSGVKQLPLAAQVPPVPPGARLKVGATVCRPVVIEQTGQRVGWANFRVMDPVNAIGHFSTYQGFQRVEVWRLVTFQFLHAGPTHLILNMLGLWLFGGTVERKLGFRKYAAFYLVCGIFGGLLYMVLNLLGNVIPPGAEWLHRLPGLLVHDTTSPLVGASAGVFGVIVACAYLEPKEKVQILFIPIGVPLPWFAYGYVAFSLFNLFSGSANAGGEAAHVGGAIAGYYFIRHSHLLRDFFDVLGDSRRPGGGSPGTQARAAEVDRILQKVSRQGADSLTSSERRALASHVRSERAGAGSEPRA
jgi:membrane associated rhomboid family serine protease